MIATKESFVRARVNTRLKNETEKIFNKLGITTTDAIRIFLTRVQRDKGLPFDMQLHENNSDILMPTAKRQQTLDSFYDDEAR